VILDRTSLYAESGGQIADAGQIVAGKVVLEVLDVQKPVKGLFSHRVRVVSGEVNSEQSVETKVNPDWRLGACQAHSATHVVHAALRQVLGPNALQSGSYNKPGYMRLDFAWGESLSESTKSEIEEVSNLAIRADLAVSAQFMTLPDAKDWGAIALFGETYDEMVRVVQVGGPWSRELCGGTHVSRSSQIGLVSLTGESSVGSGVRRIEAEVGIAALRSLISERNILRRLSSELKAPQSELETRFAESLEQLKLTQKALEELKLKSALAELTALVGSAQKIGEHSVIATILNGVDSAEVLRQVALSARDRLGEQGVVILGSIVEEKPVVMVGVGKQAQSSVNAGAIAKAAAAVLGGGGGGKADFAQAGGSDSSKLQEALKVAKDQIS
jgi:alanyl-tRNA synthetase